MKTANIIINTSLMMMSRSRLVTISSDSNYISSEMHCTVIVVFSWPQPRFDSPHLEHLNIQHWTMREETTNTITGDRCGGE